jgi:hypothetical protein
MKVYKLEMDDIQTGGLISDDLQDLFTEIELTDDFDSFKITSFEMSKEELDNLPEFEGF